jgi:hypothetical protein
MDNHRVRFFSCIGPLVSRTNHFSHPLHGLSSPKSIWPTTTLAMADAPPAAGNAQEGAHRAHITAESKKRAGPRKNEKVQDVDVAAVAA